MIKSIVADERVKLDLVNGFDPLPISSYDEHSFGYQIIKKTVQGIFPQVNVAPGKSVTVYLSASLIHMEEAFTFFCHLMTSSPRYLCWQY